jgi:hypothetical protein
LQIVEEDCPEPKSGEARVRVLTAGVALPDLMAREGIHPETPSVPFTPGWDLVGVVDRLGEDLSGLELGMKVAAMPISGAYAEFVCLRQRELVPVPPRVGRCGVCQPCVELHHCVPDVASLREGKAKATRTDSRCSRRCRNGTIAIGPPRRIGDVRNLFLAWSVGSFRTWRNSNRLQGQRLRRITASHLHGEAHAW